MILLAATKHLIYIHVYMKQLLSIPQKNTYFKHRQPSLPSKLGEKNAGKKASTPYFLNPHKQLTWTTSSFFLSFFVNLFIFLDKEERLRDSLLVFMWKKRGIFSSEKKELNEIAVMKGLFLHENSRIKIHFIFVAYKNKTNKDKVKWRRLEKWVIYLNKHLSTRILK